MSTIGWFGKLPSHGDFLRRRAPEAFVNLWDRWLQECMVSSRQRLGDQWLRVYLTSPVWRFFLCGGIAGSSSFAGVLVPSVDRVGRYFPLTILAELPASLPPMAVAIHGREWLQSVEVLALQALEADDLQLEAFDAQIQASAESLANVEQYYGVDLGESFPAGASHWRLPMISADRMAASMIDPLMYMVGRHLQPMSLWWTDGSDHVSASCLLARSLPDPKGFGAMLDGRWRESEWAGVLDEGMAEEVGEFHYRIASGGVSETGPVRQMNQDRYLDRPEAGMWCVADGMGGHSRGEYASQLAVDVLNSLEPAATLSAALESAQVGLSRANADLLRLARTQGGGRSGSTVVVLAIRQHEWGVAWAGDSRAYLLRDGVLRVLTRDHASGAESQLDFDDCNPPPSNGEITRALGGEDTLLLDRNTGRLHPGDRFLLCSDGLHAALDHNRTRDLLLQNADAHAAAQALLQAAIAAGSRDNISAVVVQVEAQ